MRFPSEEIVKRLRQEYPVGTRVELVHMDDIQAPPVGTKGTVRGVDDAGSIMVRWDTGSGLSVAYGEDSCRKLNTVKTICYGEEHVWDSRSDAATHFIKAMASSEGSERERYTKIYIELVSGLNVCTDLTDQHICKYCGKIAEGSDEEVLCNECRELFGHTFFNEL